MTDDDPDDRPADAEAEPADPRPAAVLRTADLLGGRSEVWIDHNGERYRLRVTRRGKLILQK